MQVSMKKKLLIISSIIPYPLTHGGAIAQYYFLEKLSEKFTIFFNAIINSPAEQDALNELSKSLPAVKVVPFINFKQKTSEDKLLQPARSFLNLIRSFTPKKNEHKKDDFDNYTYPLQLFSKGFIQFLEDVIKNEKIEIVQLEFFDTLSLIKALPKHVKKVSVVHEITSKRLSLSAENSVQQELYKQYIVNCYKLTEYNFLKDADKVIVFNEDDKNLLSSINGSVTISPYGIPQKLIIRNKVADKYDHFLFIGGQNHDPNRAGVEWFLKEIYIAHYNTIQLPLYIVGNWDDSFKEQYKSYTKVIFTGIVEDLSAVYENAIMVTPVLSGSGLRTKILHAFANKIPVLSTTFACEGLLNKEAANPHVILFDTAADFMMQAEQLLKNPQNLQILAEEGFFYYERNFAANTLIDKRIKALMD